MKSALAFSYPQSDTAIPVLQVLEGALWTALPELVVSLPSLADEAWALLDSVQKHLDSHN